MEAPSFNQSLGEDQANRARSKTQPKPKSVSPSSSTLHDPGNSPAIRTFRCFPWKYGAWLDARDNMSHRCTRL